MDLSVPTNTSALLSIDLLSKFSTSLDKIQDLNTDGKTTNVNQPIKQFLETAHDKSHFLNHCEAGASDNIMDA